jgi:hypothetical protein
MVTAESLENGRPFSVGEVMNRAIAVIRANPLATFGIAFLFGALPQQLFRFFTRPFATTDPTAAMGLVALSIASVLLSMFLASLVAGAIVRVTIGFAEDEKVSFGESVSTGLAKALPLLGLSVLMAIALVLGFMLLVVPGVILLVMWAVASPALVAENIGVIEAFGRSRQLTKGARWRVFGLGLLMLVIFWIISAISGVLFYASGGIESAASGGSIPFILFSVVVGTVVTAFTGAVQTNLYLALRDWKDGTRLGALAEVFA